MLSKIIIKKSITFLILTSVIGVAFANHTPETGGEEDPAFIADEKCAGVVMRGKGDGKSTVGGIELEWIYVPAGSCAKISGSKIIYD
jgi:uncharacterized membrane protein